MARKQPRMRELYERDVSPALLEKFGYGSSMMIP
jgi:hypothetical protein